MYISKLHLKNYRLFENTEITFDPRCTVLIGINGAGKSSILKAAAMAFDSFLIGMQQGCKQYIQSKDARLVTRKAGSRLDTQAQYPVEISAEIVTDDQGTIPFSRTLTGKDRRTTVKEAKDIIEYGKNKLETIQKTDKDVVLPIVAYYSTDRLWPDNRGRRTEKKFSRQEGYVGCLSTSQNTNNVLNWISAMTYQELQTGQRIPELHAVLDAISRIFERSDESISKVNTYYDVASLMIQVVIYKGDSVEVIPVDDLSDGGRESAYMVADIAYRMALLNPQMLDDVLNTPGAIIIDEIDMHLHPSWQKRILSDLMAVFSNAQFIVTTHSPGVLANLQNKNIRALDHGKIFSLTERTYGRTGDEIYKLIMGTDIRPADVLSLLDRFDRLMNDDRYQDAKKVLEEIGEVLGQDADDYISRRIQYDLEAEE